MAGAPAWASESAPPDWAKGTPTPAAPAWAKPSAPPATFNKPHFAAGGIPESSVFDAVPQPFEPQDLRNAAAAIDIPLGIPAWVTKIGQRGMTDVVAAVSGDQEPLKAGRVATEQDWQDENFLQSPLETTFGVNPAETFMGDVGSWQSEHINAAAEATTKRTGNPEHGEAVRQIADIVLAKAADIIGGSVRGVKSGAKAAANAAKKAMAAERMKTAQPTGTAPPPEWAKEDIAGVEKRMDTQPLPDESAPVTSGRVAEMRKRSAGLKPGEPIAHPDEGDLSMMDSMARSGYEPSPEASQEIHSALAAPELHADAVPQVMRRTRQSPYDAEKRVTIDRRAMDRNANEYASNIAAERYARKMQAERAARAEAARDVAAEKVTTVVKADKVKQTATVRKAKIGKQLNLVQTIKQMGGIHLGEMRDVTGEGRAGKNIKGIPPGVFHNAGHGLDDLATMLKDKGYDINTADVDGGVQQLRDMIRADLNGETQLPMEAAFDEWERQYRGDPNEAAQEPMRASDDIESEYAKRKTMYQDQIARAEKMLSEPNKNNGHAYAYSMIDQAKKGLKATGMQLSAERRQATGKLTAKEQLAATKKEASTYIGKAIVVDGKKAKIISNPFGKVKVEFEDGTTKTFERKTIIGEDGKIKPSLLIGAAAVAGGAAVGAAVNNDNPLEGALIGAGAGFGIARVASVLHDIGAGHSLQAAINVVKPSLDPIRAKAIEVNNGKVARVKAGLRDIAAIQKAYMKAIPDKARREHITHVVQSGDLSSLSQTERYFVSLVEQAYGKMGSAAQEAGVIGRLLGKEYVPMMWDMKDTSTKAFFDELLASGAGDQATAGTFTPHSLHRSIPTYLQGKAAGLKPLTLDHAELLGLYAKSVLKATENANALYTLKSMKLPNNLYAVEPISSRTPKDYITDHKIAGLEGFAVHPEMLDALRIGFDSYKPGVIQKAMLSVAFTAKRLSVTYSLFHPMSLMVAYTGAGGNPFGFMAGAAARGTEHLTGNRIKIPFKSAVDKALEQYDQAGAKDTTDYLIRNGLEIGGGIEDTVGRDSFLKLTGFLDRVLGSEKTGLKPFTAVDENIHQFTWGYTHTGMKLTIASREFERMLADPKNAGKDINQIAADATSYTNNIFGGLNWERMIEGMKSKAGKAVAGAAYSKHGRAVMQTGLFAPDWLLSTMRSWTQAVPGLSENAAVGRMSRAYLARSLLYTMVITDALNYHYSGHHVWDNDFRTERQKDADPDNVNRTVMDQIHDMTYIDMGDGTRVEGNKHLFEAVHAMTAPGQFAMGKLSSIVTDPLAAGMNKQWLSPTWAPNITEGGTTAQKAHDYLKWFGQHHMPISLQQLGQGAYGGTFGFPRHGKHEDERQLLNEQRQELKQERDLQ